MVYKHAYLNILLLLHSAFMLCVVKIPLKGEIGGHALTIHVNYIVDHGKSWYIFEFLWTLMIVTIKSPWFISIVGCTRSLQLPKRGIH